MTSTQVVVIGGGPGGYAAAFLAADLGLSTALVDPEPNPGGVCVYRGCIPSKALLHVAKLIDESRHAKAWGIEFGEPKIDLDKLRAFKDAVVKRLTSGTGQLVKHRKVNYIQGLAELVDAHNLRVKKAAGAEEQLQFEHAIIATGSVPAIPPMLRVDDPRVMDSTSALDLPDIPKSMLVVGGGYIGLELGSVYAQLGSRVTVVEMTGGLLPGADRDLVDILARRVNETMTAVLLNPKAFESRSKATALARTIVSSCSTACSSRSGDVPMPACRVWIRRASASTSGGSLSSTSNSGPASRRSLRSATSSASPCWRTRPRTRVGLPSR
jgi:dihydrolipoamide dehydrogenase